MSSLSLLLASSRQAHSRYRQAAGRINTQGGIAQHPSLSVAGEAVREALKARSEAHALDPDMTDPAWAEDMSLMRAGSEQLVDFYIRYLAPEAHQVCSV